MKTSILYDPHAKCYFSSSIDYRHLTKQGRVAVYSTKSKRSIVIKSINIFTIDAYTNSKMSLNEHRKICLAHCTKVDYIVNYLNSTYSYPIKLSDLDRSHPELFI